MVIVALIAACVLLIVDGAFVWALLRASKRADEAVSSWETHVDDALEVTDPDAPIPYVPTLDAEFIERMRRQFRAEQGMQP